MLTAERLREVLDYSIVTGQFYWRVATSHRQKGKFMAQIKAPGRRKFIGYFADKYAAHAAYLAAKREHHEGCTV